MTPGQPDLDAIRAAHERIASWIHRTPVHTCRTADLESGASLFFKCENLQKVGAFKIRGATNAVFSLDGVTASRGVATHSSGNHAAALAQAGRWRGIPTTVVMPDNAPTIKKAAVAGYGADIIYCEPTLQAREDTLHRVLEDTGAAMVHPYDDPRVIAGQATAALELCEQVESLDAVIAPVGGGGLLSGTCLSVAALCPDTRIYGAEPAAVDDAWQSLQAGRIMPVTGKRSIADGLLTSLGRHTFPIIREHVAEILTVSEAEIAAAMRFIWERMKLVTEPSAAVTLAAILRYPDRFAGQRVGVILTGGNADLDKLPWNTDLPDA